MLEIERRRDRPVYQNLLEPELNTKGSSDRPQNFLTTPVCQPRVCVCPIVGFVRFVIAFLFNKLRVFSKPE